MHIVPGRPDDDVAQAPDSGHDAIWFAAVVLALVAIVTLAVMLNGGIAFPQG